MAKSVKLADIAELVGVSIVTVSKALSDKDGVSDEVREKIKKTASELGYRTSNGSAASKIGTTGNIGVIIPKRFLDQTSFYWELYQRIVNKLTLYGCFCILEIIDEAIEEKKELPKVVTDRRVDGIIALGQVVDEYTDYLQKNADMPVMFLDFYNSSNKIDAVISDSYYGMYQLTNYVIAMGHKRIGFLGTVLSTSSITDRYFGYCKAMMENGLTVEDKWVIKDRKHDVIPEAEISFELPYELPTAFVCNCDVAAYRLIARLQERGVRVPEDVSVAGYDNYSFPDSSRRPLTTYDVGMKKMAETCVDTLLKKITGEIHEQGVQIVTGHLVIRDSVKNIK